MSEDNIDYTDDFQYYLERFVVYQNYMKIVGGIYNDIPAANGTVSAIITGYKDELCTIYSNLSEEDKLLVAVTCGIPDGSI